MSKSKTMTLEDLAAKAWLKFYENTKTPAPHRSNMNKVLEGFGPKRLVHRITTGMIEDIAEAWVASGTSEKTVNRRLSCLSRMLTWAHQRSWLIQVPYIPKYKEKAGRLRWQTAEEEIEMLNLLRGMDLDDLADVVAVLADTGCRRGELLGLKWEDVDDGWIRLWETKGGTARSIPLTKRAYWIIDSRVLKVGCEKGSGPFTNVSPRSLESGWNKARKLMGLEDDKGFTPHCLRHGCASRLVQNGVPLLTVKELLGHAKWETTLIYAHLAPKNLVDAIACLEIGR